MHVSVNLLPDVDRYDHKMKRPRITIVEWLVILLIVLPMLLVIVFVATVRTEKWVRITVLDGSASPRVYLVRQTDTMKLTDGIRLWLPEGMIEIHAAYTLEPVVIEKGVEK